MAKKNASNWGDGAVAAGRAARDNPYVKRLIEDPALRDDLRSAFVSARKAYGRIDGSSPAKALEDKRVQRELKAAAESLRSAADALREPPKRKKRRGRLLLFALAGAVLALALSEDLRNKALDLLFGAEEEFSYTGSTTSDAAPAPAEPAAAS